MVDINGDGSKEIIVGTYEGKLHAWNKDGAELNGFPFKAEDKIGSSPAMGDINGDKKNEIVFGSDDGMLYVLNGNGSSLPGFPKATEGSIRSSPALGDLNGDGSLEIVVGSLDTGLYSIGKDGSIVCGFPVITGSSSIGGIYSSPALGDIDGDGSLDIAIGETKYEEALSSILGSRVSSGRVFAVNGKGEAIDGFPDGLGIGNIVGFSSPVLADINGDGSLEIMVGSADGLHCLDAKGVSMPGFPVKTDGSLQDNFIAVGDLDGDGKLEIVSGCTDGRLYVWRSDGSAYPGFPIQTAGFLRHMTLGDIDKDGKQEILGGSTDNRVHAWKLDGSEVAGFPKVTLGDVKTAPTLGDLNGDGSLELAVGSNDGSLYVWKISQSYGKLQWPMIQQNPEHTGVFKQS
jgi:WD40 repeat protein